jgi:flagellar hook protein FlgE
MSINSDGCVAGIFTNGVHRELYRMPIAQFPCPEGLELADGKFFCETMYSGEAHVGLAQTGGNASIMPGTIESSPVESGAEKADSVVLDTTGFVSAD